MRVIYLFRNLMKSEKRVSAISKSIRHRFRELWGILCGNSDDYLKLGNYYMRMEEERSLTKPNTGYIKPSTPDSLIHSPQINIKPSN